MENENKTEQLEQVEEKEESVEQPQEEAVEETPVQEETEPISYSSNYL